MSFKILLVFLGISSENCTYLKILRVAPLENILSQCVSFKTLLVFLGISSENGSYLTICFKLSWFMNTNFDHFWKMRRIFIPIIWSPNVCKKTAATLPNNFQNFGPDEIRLKVITWTLLILHTKCRKYQCDNWDCDKFPRTCNPMQCASENWFI